MKDIFELANIVQNANFKDEQTVRNIVKRVAQIANKPIQNKKKNKLLKRLQTIIKSIDFATIAKMLNEKK